MNQRHDEDRWAEVDALFARVLEVPPEERGEYLSGLRDIDGGLKSAVEELLRTHDESESFLGAPPTLSPDILEELASRLRGSGLADRQDETEAAAALPGDRIGAWRIVEELGRGGMSTVYLVERADGPYEQTGALKLLRRGLDTEDILRRFRAERQILSSLAHPSIAGLLDGGATSDGRPYLVMERVEGRPITEWCDTHGASVEQRLRLFAEVARAVQHAHTKLVVHRDLKPSNILVTAEGRVKLLDFGIAKLLDPDLIRIGEVHTRTGHRALTPEYASPEQVRGDPVTTATDVYQLGLLLHRLLTGARPREARGASASLAHEPTPTPTAPSRLARRMSPEAAEARTLTPERLSRRLHGDLDAIVLTALEVEPDRRYGSAVAMAEDVFRHLDGRPIAARSAGSTYRLRKFLVRHRWVAPVAAAALLLLTLFVATSVRHGRQLAAERDAARAQAERAERVQSVLVDVFRSANPWEEVTLAAAGETADLHALAAGTERARIALAEEPELQIDLLTVIARVYMGLGLPGQAGALFEEALGLRRQVHGPRSVSVAVGLRQLGRTLAVRGLYDSAAAVLTASVDLVRDQPTAPDTLLLGALVDLGYAEKGRGRYEEAEQTLVEVLAVAEAGPDDLDDLEARAYHNLAVLYPRLGRPADARSAAQRALEIRRTQYGEGHLRTAAELAALAVALWKTSRDDFERPIALMRRAIGILEPALGPLHRRVLIAKATLASMLRSAGRLEEAIALQRQFLAVHEESFGPSHPWTASAHHLLAVVLYNAGELEEAERHARRAYEIRAGDPATRPGAAESLITLCGIQLHRSQLEAAENSCREATELLEEAGLTESVAGPLAECRLAHLLAARGALDEAGPLFDHAIPILWRARITHVPGHVHECLQFAASAYRRLGRTDEAERLRRLAAGVSRRGMPGVTR